MPLFMDVHTTGATLALNDVAHAHAADLKCQDAYGAQYLRYWADESNGKIDLLPGRCAGRRHRGHRPPRGPRTGRRPDLPGTGRRVSTNTISYPALHH